MPKAVSTKQPINGRSSQATSTSLAFSSQASYSKEVVKGKKRVVQAADLYNNFFEEITVSYTLITSKGREISQKADEWRYL